MKSKTILPEEERDYIIATLINSGGEPCEFDPKIVQNCLNTLNDAESEIEEKDNQIAAIQELYENGFKRNVRLVKQIDDQFNEISELKAEIERLKKEK